jgi:DNA-directed RNA polymerase III subunit RPC8
VNDDGSTFYFDVGEIVRFRVETEEWHDQIPNAPELADMPVQDRKPPYSIIGSMQMAGLGPIAWW